MRVLPPASEAVPLFIVSALLLAAPLTQLRGRQREAGRLPSKLSLVCVDEVGEDAPVKLVVFDFDETLTVNSVLGEFPEPHLFKHTILAGPYNPFRNGRHLERAFEGPSSQGTFGFVESLSVPRPTDRIMALNQMLKDMRTPEEPLATYAGGPPLRNRRRSPRVAPALSVLTYNIHGPVAVLNTLDSVGLATHFQAIWSLWPVLMGDRLVYGVYRDNTGVWRPANVVPPDAYVHPNFDSGESHKASMIKTILRMPQLFGLPESDGLGFENVVLVDNAGENLQGMLRSVHVYSDVRPHAIGLIEIGGIGYWDTSDFSVLLDFIREPALHAHRGPDMTVRRTFPVEPALQPVVEPAAQPVGRSRERKGFWPPSWFSWAPGWFSQSQL